MFTRTGTTWTQQAHVKASNTGKAAMRANELGDGDQFGFSLALSGDGNTLAVGAITEDGAAQQINGNDERRLGAVCRRGVRVRANGQRLGAAGLCQELRNQEAGDLLGFSVALSGDGNTLAAAAFDEERVRAAASIRRTTINP